MLNLFMPKKTIECFYYYLYYHIINDFDLFGNLVDIVLEPIFLFNIDGDTISEFTYIGELVENNFVLDALSAAIKFHVTEQDGSVLDQVIEIENNNIGILHDNPLMFPWQRVEKYLVDWVPNNIGEFKAFEGICHFHPIPLELHNSHDKKTMTRIASELGKYKINRVFGLVITNSENIAHLRKKELSEFLRIMMESEKNTIFDGLVFDTKGEFEKINIILK